MILKSLEIQGFKSFPDKIKVPFNDGITAVVGPNGSGKSNISDAIRWVLGETSSKQLRGGGKMEDVIFGGTQLRSAMGFASVALTLDNTDHRLEIESDEVTIGRKYYRSGDSEYSINGQNVRLKDIYELFLDTGLGRDGYSIIGQGKIAEIVGSKSAERREIFEEASGIAKYRYRKNEAERNLKNSEENLVRLRDILNELEERVGPLERESKKAKQFLELKEQREKHEVTLWVDTIKRAKETLRTQQRKIEIAQQDYDNNTQNIEKLEQEMDTIRLEGERLIVDIENLNRSINSVKEEISSNDAQIAVLKNDITHNLATISAIKLEMDEAGKTGGAIDEKIESFNVLILECEQNILKTEKRIAEKEALLDEITNQSRKTGERRGEITVTLTNMTNKVTQLKVDAAFAQSTVIQSNERIEVADKELLESNDKLTQLNSEFEKTQTSFNELLEKLTQLNNIKQGLDLKGASKNTQKENAEKQLVNITRELENAKQRISVLKELEKNLDGYQHSVKTVLKSAQSGKLRGVIGSVASIMNVQEGYETAVETALGFALQNVVVQDETCAKQAMQFLKSENAGRATFLPLNTIKASHLDARLSGSAKIAASLVQCDEKYKNIVSSMLGRIVVVDDINEASFIAKQNGYRFRIVTRDGQVINAGGSFTGGSVARSAGMFSRKQEIEELKTTLVKLTENQIQAQKTCMLAKEEADKISAEIVALDSEIITLNGDKIRKEVELDKVKAQTTQQKELTDNLSFEIKSLKTNIVNADKKHNDAVLEETQLSKQIEILESELFGIDGSDDDFIKTRTRLSSELGELKLSLLSIQKDKDMHTQSIESLTSRTDEASERKEAQLENINRLEQLIEQNNIKIENLEKEKTQKADSISGIEQKINATRQTRFDSEKDVTQLKEKVKGLTTDREELGKEVARLSERKIAVETEFEQTNTKLWEEYQLTFSQAETRCVDFETTTELRRLVQEIRGKIKALGNVNVNAIDEFKEVGERYTFMKTQVSDVEKAKDELLKLIGELCAEMKEIFAESFVAINKNFTRIFTELFGGGTASLELSDPENILESGIEIKVAPPGKVIKNLSSLSGGEQALVAISIYFAILGVNPAPFCILDEIEAALDDVNVTRYAQYLRKVTKYTQFIVITHRRGTMEEADVLYGVTMQEDGVSKLLKLDTNSVDVDMLK